MYPLDAIMSHHVHLLHVDVLVEFPLFAQVIMPNQVRIESTAIRLLRQSVSFLSLSRLHILLVSKQV